MHVLVVTFSLRDLAEAAYRAHVETVAPVFAGVPGLLSKTWLANAETNRYGGVYLFADKAALDAYLGSEIVAGLRGNPHFVDLDIQRFGMLEAPGRITHGLGAEHPSTTASAGTMAGVSA